MRGGWFHPQSGREWILIFLAPEGIACWFIDTAYNEESFFVRHAYFLGASDPYQSLKTTLKAEIDEECVGEFEQGRFHGRVGRFFTAVLRGRPRAHCGEVINHLGDD